MLLQLILSGLAVGGVYALVGLGYNATFWTLGIVNFGHGEFLMIGVMLALGLKAWFGVPLFLAVVIALFIVALLGIILERVAINPLLKYPTSIGWMVSTLGAGIVLQNVAAITWGTEDKAFPPLLGSHRAVSIAGAAVPVQMVLIFLTAVGVIILFEFFINKTLFGKAIKATALDKETARMMGIPAKRIVTFSIILSALLAGLAGVLIAPISSASPYMGAGLAIKGFSTAVLGGMGNSRGTFIAGLMIGIMEMLASGYLAPAIKDTIGLLVLFLILLVMPQGLFGRKVLEKV